MTKRPAWSLFNNRIVRKNFEFEFNPGFSVTQKKKNVKALHKAIGGKTLEVSTKSDEMIGQKLSAFNLTYDGNRFECVFQASKKYEYGGPYIDLLTKSPKEAKIDVRHASSGKLIGFEYIGEEFALEPKTFFYDYMYIKAVQQSLTEEDILEILNYDYFTDIEFNPKKSINCQAKSVAIIKAMLKQFGQIPELNREDFYKFYVMIYAENA